MNLSEKENRLLEIIKGYPSALVAYSGGLDSAMVLWAAVRALGPEKVWGVTAQSESYATGERDEAIAIAREIGLPADRHIFIETKELSDPRYAANSPERCYFCKGELFGRLQTLARRLDAAAVFDGTNRSDLGDFRPGRKSAAEHNIVAPLLEAELDKDELRALARKHNLSFAEKPAAACLASRIPTGVAITPERLHRIDRAETAVRALGFDGFRVRYHGNLARLEFEKNDIPKVFENGTKEKLIRAIKEAGFRFVTIDLEGYRQGSMNEPNRKGEL